MKNTFAALATVTALVGSLLLASAPAAAQVVVRRTRVTRTTATRVQRATVVRGDGSVVRVTRVTRTPVLRVRRSVAVYR